MVFEEVQSGLEAEGLTCLDIIMETIRMALSHWLIFSMADRQILVDQSACRTFKCQGKILEKSEIANWRQGQF
jgi:hypothetical protein